jgi:hypothetical protein
MDSEKFYLVNTKEELAKLQEAFFAVLRKELNEKDEIHYDERIDKLIAPNKILSSSDRMQLYAQQYWWRLIQSLESDFPLLRRVLGEELFSKIIKEYILKHPSSSYTLRHLGRKLPTFIEQEIELPSDIRLLAKDVSIFELYIIESFFSRTEVSINDEKFLNTNSENLILSLQPHVFLLNLSYPLHEYIDYFRNISLKDNQTNAVLLRKKESFVSEMEILKRSTKIIIYLYEYEVFAKEVSDNFFHFLLTIREGDKKISEVILEHSGLTQDEIFLIFNECSKLKLLSFNIKE